MATKPVFLLWIYCVCVVTCSTAQDTTQQIHSGRTNAPSQLDKPYVILISADGFRYDFAERYQAANLLKYAQAGVKADYLTSAYPSLTFPNHYSIVTGLYPAHHGLVDNTFYDRAKQVRYDMNNKKQVADSSWYGGTPLWVLAEKHQMLSASFYWVASESAIQNTLPTYFYHYSSKIPIDRRLQTVKAWLQLPPESRPHFISFYFSDVDHAAHVYGPDSKEAADAVRFVDESIGKMVEAVRELNLPVNFIFVSDHGMTNVDYAAPLLKPAMLDTARFVVPTGDALVQIYARNKSDIKPTYRQLRKEATDYKVYLPNQLPRQWHYSKKDDRFNRIGDIILVPVLPKVFGFSGKTTNMGKHGYDPFFPDMRASFYAWGPAFKTGLTINGFENIHIYPLIAEVLGLPVPQKIDGKLSVLKPVLR